MQPKIVGYEFLPQDGARQNMNRFAETGGWTDDGPLPAPVRATPIFEDASGNPFVKLPIEDRVANVPFIPGTETNPSGGGFGELGGFVSAANLPSPDSNTDLSSIAESLASGVDSRTSLDWLGRTATAAMLGAAPGGITDKALRMLGVANPLRNGPMGAALGSALGSVSRVAGMNALGSAALSQAGSLLGGLLGSDGASSSATSVAQSALQSILPSVLGGNSGGSLGLPSSLSQLGNVGAGDLLDQMGVGGWAGPLDQAADAFGNSVPGGDVIKNIVTDPSATGELGINPNIDLNAISANALNNAADQLLDQWQVDDESSAAEHVAHKMVNDNKAQIKEAVSDPNGFMARLQKMFSGEAPGAGMPAVRITDLDDGADVSLMGVGNILFEGLPVSRITDLVAGPKAPAPGKPIVDGAATVLSAELPTAFVGAKTAVPTVMIKGAATILVGGAVASIAPPATASDPATASNGAPADAQAPAPKTTGSGEGEGGGEGQGADRAGEASQTPVDTNDQKSIAPENPNGGNTEAESTSSADQSPNDDSASSQVSSGSDTSSNPDGEGLGESSTATNEPAESSRNGDGSQTTDSNNVQSESSNDDDGHQVELCRDVADLPGNDVLGIEHHWIRTPEMEAGLGQAGAGVPGLNGAGGAAREYWEAGGQTTINDHSGRGSQPGAHCEVVPNVDLDCVHEELSDGRKRGIFPMTNCQNVAAGILHQCSTVTPPSPRPTPPPRPSPTPSNSSSPLPYPEPVPLPTPPQNN